MLPKSLSQPVRPCPVARQHQNPAGIFINPVHQFGLFIQFKPQCLQHTVNMAAGVGTALHRQTGGFVQNNDIVVFINNQRENNSASRREISERFAPVSGCSSIGGTLTSLPAASFSDVSARLPSTLICFVRNSFCSRPSVRLG